MWGFFRSHKVFLVFGLFKQTGYTTMGEKYLDCFATKVAASAFAARVRADGFEGRRFTVVEMREVEPKNE